MPALLPSGNHFIVCGDGPLAYRVTEELTSRYREQVTVIMPSRRKNSGPRISELPGVRLLERLELTSEAFTELHDLGFDVACVDPDPAAQGVALARRLGLPLVIGDAFREEALRAAGIDSCAAMIGVTSSDVVNLETALQARALREDLRIVLRLFDDDLAQRVQETAGNIVSRSVSYMAAPAFAVAMLEHSVLRTIAVGRHVLLGSSLVTGQPPAS